MKEKISDCLGEQPERDMRLEPRNRDSAETNSKDEGGSDASQ